MFGVQLVMTGVENTRVKLVLPPTGIAEVEQRTEDPWREQEDVEEPGRNVRFAGTGSVTVTFCAAAVPEFATLTVYVMFEPAFAEEGPDFVMER